MEELLILKIKCKRMNAFTSSLTIILSYAFELVVITTVIMMVIANTCIAFTIYYALFQEFYMY